MAKPLILTFYRSGLRRKWRWRLVHRNGNKVASSAQGGGYSDLSDAENGACLALSGSDSVIDFVGDETTDQRVTGRDDIEVVFEGEVP